MQDNNIIHRDIKPQNILFFPPGMFKVTDVGAGKQVLAD